MVHLCILYLWIYLFDIKAFLPFSVDTMAMITWYASFISNKLSWTICILSVLRIRFILICIRIRILLRIRPKIEEIPTFVLLFFSIKNIFLQNKILFCYSRGKYLCPLNISLIFLEKCMIFLWFLLKFSMILSVFFAIWIRIQLTKMKRIQIRKTDFNFLNIKHLLFLIDETEKK